MHYPGYPSSPARATHTLGGLPTIAKVHLKPSSFSLPSGSASGVTYFRLFSHPPQVRSSDPGSRLELRFRPEDPDCHPTFGEPRASTGLLLRLSRPKGGCAPPRAEVVARVRTAYHFEGERLATTCSMKCLVLITLWNGCHVPRLASFDQLEQLQLVASRL